MKTIIAIISFITISSICSASTMNVKPPFEQVLQKQITYPEFAKENNVEGFVLVSFSFDHNGKIQIKDANSNDESLKSYVISKLSGIQLFGESNDTEEHIMKFEFKLL
jgi:hypothetical protein